MTGPNSILNLYCYRPFTDVNPFFPNHLLFWYLETINDTHLPVLNTGHSVELERNYLDKGLGTQLRSTLPLLFEGSKEDRD